MLSISFKQFLVKEDLEEEKQNIKDTLNSLPNSHANLVRGYKFKFQAGNTLKGDNQHIGYMDKGPKEICIAAPWNYPRQFTFLHEIAHRVWERFMTPKLKEEWNKIIKNTKNKQDQSAEELFCMAYANHYSKNKIIIHTHKEWDKFIERKVPS